MITESTDGWHEYKKLVLHEFEQLHNQLTKLSNQQEKNIQRLRKEFHITVDKAEKRICEEIRQVEESQFKLRDEVIDNTIDITILKVKAGIWGAIAGGVVGVIISLLLEVISKGLGG